LPTLPTKTSVVVLMHQLEARKPTNTGRVALRCLPNSGYAVHGRDDRSVMRGTADIAGEKQVDSDWLNKAARPVLLFPAEDARPLADFAAEPGPPLTLIVPDATWSQAARMRKRVPGLSGVPCAHLPLGLTSEYRLRHDPRPSHVSTLQAIAHALGILEGDEMLTEELLRVQRLVVERTLWTKGRIAPHLVEGGLSVTAVAPQPAPVRASPASGDD
jgi:DTW domain-containing protein YfiP